MIGQTTGYVLLGSPGAGKGTIGQYLSDNFGVEHFSSGDILRKEVSEKTEIGQKIAETMNNGGQVSDEIVTQLVLDRIKELLHNGRSFIIDGFPQTLPQEKQLNAYSRLHNLNIQYICVSVDPNTALERMIQRVSCSVCNKVFSKVNITAEKCTKCEGKLTMRKSDNPELAKQRLAQFQKTTKFVMENVEKRFHPILINGNEPIESIREHLIKEIKF